MGAEAPTCSAAAHSLVAEERQSHCVLGRNRAHVLMRIAVRDNRYHVLTGVWNVLRGYFFLRFAWTVRYGPSWCFRCATGETAREKTPRRQLGQFEL